MIRFAALFVLGSASIAAAEPIAIRSGEHSEFSRLVLSIPEASDWQVGRGDSGYILRLANVDPEYETDEIFERISRERLSGVRTDGNDLVLDVECECHANAFLWRSDRLVVDIVNGPAPDDSEFETVIDGTRAAELTFFPTYGDPDPAVGEAMGNPADPQVAPSPSPVEVADVPEIRSSEPQPLPSRLERDLLVPSFLDRVPQTSQDTSEFEAALLEGISRAATQGLLIAAPTSEAEEPEATEEVADATPAAPTVEMLTFDNPGITTRTSIEDHLSDLTQPAITDGGSSCLDDRHFRVAEWADERAFHEQLGAIRDGLTRDTGDVDTDEVIAFARFYVHFGFGVEADALLTYVEEESVRIEAIQAMAKIVDGERVTSPFLNDQFDCNSDVALWSVLAAQDENVASLSDRDSVIQAHRRLPDPLRGHLGQRLADLYVSVGDTDTALILLRASSSSGTGEQTDQDSLEAAIELGRGNVALATRQLDRLSKDDPRLSSEDVMQLVDLRIEQGLTVSQETLELLQVLRFENRDNPAEVQRLLVSEIEARIANSDPVSALNLIAESDDGTDEPWLELRSKATTELALSSSVDEFLEFAFGAQPAVDADTENLIARRLVDLGFPSQARDVLSTEARREAAADRRLLQAQIAIDTGDSASVARILAGVDGEEAAELKRRASLLVGDFGTALEIASGETGEEWQSIAWQAEAWSQLELAGDPVLSELAARLSADISADPEPVEESGLVGSLQDRLSLLEESDETDAFVGEFLKRFEVAATSDS